jgi:hypothetical protein
MERTHMEFDVGVDEAPWNKEESCDRAPRVIHILEDTTHTTPISYKTRPD